MRKIILTLFLSSLFSSFVLAEVVTKIEIAGNKRVSNETIKIYGGIKQGNDYSESDLNKILTNLYSTNFFKDVRINLVNGVLKISLVEYPLINNLIILGEPREKFVEEIKKILLSKKKDSYINNYLKKDVETIKKLYAASGFNSTEVKTKLKEIDKSNVDLIFEIKKGEVTKISKIFFTGDKKVREKRLRDIIASEEDKFWKIISRNTKFSESRVNLDKRLLKNYYKSIGYYDVDITSNSAEVKDSGNIELTYSIDAGKRFFIKKISTNVDPVFDKNLFFSLNDRYKKIIGSFYSPFKITKLLEEIDEIIANNNLQFVEHNVQEVVEGDSINIIFNILEGEKVLVERVNITGNTVTNEAVIRGELLIDEGDPFTNLVLDKSISKIKSRRIFNTVTSNISEGSSKDLRIIDITVEEKPTGEVSAGAGIGTNGGSFAFNVKENNWLGEGKNVGFDIEVEQDSIQGTLSFSDPNYDFLGNSLNYSLSNTTNDKPDQGYENTVTSAGVSTSFEQYKDLFTTLGLSASYDDLKTTTGASESLKKQSGTFSEFVGGYGFSLDKRNRSFMPTSGSIFKFNQSLPLYADKSFIANTISSSSYNKISENVVGAVKVYASNVTGLGDDDIRLNKRRYLTTKRLRGFQRGKVGPVDGKDHVGGNTAASVNFEASLPNFLPESTRTDVSLFLDFGNVWGVDYDEGIDESNKIRSSTGAAANWLSPIGPMSFVFSKNITKASTDKTESFNFNLGTTF